MIRFAPVLFLVLLAFPSARTDARPLLSPPPPRAVSLDATGPEAARLTFESLPEVLVRLCVTHDRERRQPYACFQAGPRGETAAGIPATDGGQYLLALQGCTPDLSECSELVDAGIIGRRLTGAFDFYATALLQQDGGVQLSGYSARPGGSLVYHAGAPGRAENRRSGCAALGEGVCGADVLYPPGALVGVSQELPGTGAAGLTFQVRDAPSAALLFEDGTGLFTGSRLTAQVVLDEYGVKGTFFLIGRMMRDYPAAVRSLAAAGHRVGNHTYSHPFLTRLTDAGIAQELDSTEQQYRAIVPGGTTRPCFRAPNGAIDRRVAAVAGARGYRQIDWTVGSQDWTRNSADAIVRNVLRDLHDGALISFHTNEAATMTALRTLLPLLQSWGYVFHLAC